MLWFCRYNMVGSWVAPKLWFCQWGPSYMTVNVLPHGVSLLRWRLEKDFCIRCSFVSMLSTESYNTQWSKLPNTSYLIWDGNGPSLYTCGLVSTYSLAHKHKHQGEISSVNKQHPKSFLNSKPPPPTHCGLDLDNGRSSIKWYKADYRIVSNDFIFHIHKY